MPVEKTKNKSLNGVISLDVFSSFRVFSPSFLEADFAISSYAWRYFVFSFFFRVAIFHYFVFSHCVYFWIRAWPVGSGSALRDDGLNKITHPGKPSSLADFSISVIVPEGPAALPRPILLMAVNIIFLMISLLRTLWQASWFPRELNI